MTVTIVGRNNMNKIFFPSFVSLVSSCNILSGNNCKVLLACMVCHFITLSIGINLSQSDVKHNLFGIFVFILNQIAYNIGPYLLYHIVSLCHIVIFEFLEQLLSKCVIKQILLTQFCLLLEILYQNFISCITIHFWYSRERLDPIHLPGRVLTLKRWCC